MARGNGLQSAVSARGCLAVGFSVKLLVIAALAYDNPAPKTLTDVRRDAYEHNNISYVETQRKR